MAFLLRFPKGRPLISIFVCVSCGNEEVRAVDGNQEPLLFDSRHLCRDCLCY